MQLFGLTRVPTIRKIPSRSGLPHTPIDFSVSKALKTKFSVVFLFHYFLFLPYPLIRISMFFLWFLYCCSLYRPYQFASLNSELLFSLYHSLFCKRFFLPFANRIRQIAPPKNMLGCSYQLVRGGSHPVPPQLLPLPSPILSASFTTLTVPPCLYRLQLEAQGITYSSTCPTATARTRHDRPPFSASSCVFPFSHSINPACTHFLNNRERNSPLSDSIQSFWMIYVFSSTAMTAPKVTLVQENFWTELHKIGNEMRLEKQGRKLFPLLEFKVEADRSIDHFLAVLVFKNTETNEESPMVVVGKTGEWVFLLFFVK